MHPFSASKYLRLPKLPLKVKIGSVLAVGSIASLIIALVGYYKLDTMHKSIADIIDHTVVEINLGLRLNRAIVDVDRTEKNMLLATTLADVTRQEELIKRYKAEVETTIGDLKLLVDYPVREKLVAIEARFDEYTNIQQHIVDLIKAEFEPPSVDQHVPQLPAIYFADLEGQLNNLALQCESTSLSENQYRVSACRLVTQELKRQLHILRSSRDNLLLEEKPRSSVQTPEVAFANSISQIYLKLDNLKNLMAPSEGADIQKFANDIGLWLFDGVNTALRREGNKTRLALIPFRNRGQNLVDEINMLTNEIVSYIDNKLNNEKRESRAIYSNGSMLIIGLSALCILLSFIFGYRTLSHLTNRLRELTHMARKVATGDLSARTPVNSQDQLGELAQSLNMMAIKSHGFTDELKKARRHAEAANRMKSQFLANMSHEIRTPMNGVLGMTELMAMTKLNRVQRRYLDRIRESGDVLLALVNDILDFSKIEAGKLDLDHTDFDLFKTIEDVVAIMAHRAQSKGLELICDIDIGIKRWVIGDPARLRQIALNLISNAVKFTERGEVFVRVRAEERAGLQQIVTLDVLDTGIGIDDETKRHLFRPFVQADSSTTRTFGGTGLGLAITKRLIELMGGEIEVASTVGEGSLFSINLPMKLPSIEQVVSNQHFLAGKKILIVDDNESASKAIANHLEFWGARVITVHSSPEALDQIRRARHSTLPFDAAVINLRLPLMDGVELLDAIRNNCEVENLKVIMLTPVRIEKEDERRLRHPFIVGQMAKPFRIDELRLNFETIIFAPNELTAANRPDTPLDADAITSPQVQLDRIDSFDPLEEEDFDESESKSHGLILIAEDNVINQDVAVGLLDKCGFKVEIARTGREALALASRKRFDAILMDCQMPEMDGYRASSEIRRLEKNSSSASRTPIIAMTASAFRGDRERCLAAGMDDYLAKPITYEKLCRALNRWVTHRQEASSPSSLSGTNPPETILNNPDRDLSETYDDESSAEMVPNSETLEEPVLDQQSLQEIRQIETSASRPGFFADIVEIFCRSADEHLQLLSHSISEGNATRVEREAHFIKGSAGNFGARRVMALCQELEVRARNNTLDDAVDLERRLVDEYQRVRSELKRVVAHQLH